MLAEFTIDLLNGGLAVDQVLIDPGDEEKVAGTGLDGANARKEQIREGVADGPNAQLVAGGLFAEEADDIEHFASVLLGVVEPGKG